MPNRAELHIILDGEGRVQVSGPIHDKLTCYALLGCAHDAIKDHTDTLTRSPIVAAKPGDVVRLSS